ncbi:ubiquinone/menaquinone biosynthesis C-methylase UbiE [Nitrosospira sp. Nsp5]|uniref:Ubiquinone/menaquinone biosynthesis C-methylase UbiE n=1 Tax=Nitrosospira multiformis TaxID=1231 RepID=A0ABY0TLA1_9PROT|nr:MULTISPECIES: class I SAM-dependent methyltransferase [Nitrosospira]PTR09946.1 ubiquinone/menaquinone biosynthesis C-methylase UbiE [Nitrosospira sp. Nsp5]SDR00738.1 Ubiquinone/menaquinone biosynthesis C-methylase UbiE [Nitrosospira multiformis]
MTEQFPAVAPQTDKKKLLDPSSSTITFYETHADEYFRRTVSLDLSHLHNRFLSLVDPGGSILDAGCGSGRDLRVFLNRGYQVTGIDASNALARLAQSYSGASCIPMRLEDLSFDQRFDAVWACASLLHFPKFMLLQILRRLYRAIVPGGVLYASVQSGYGESFASDGRFYAYYQLTEFVSLIEESGFIINDAWNSEDSLPNRPPIQWINVLAHRDSPL